MGALAAALSAAPWDCPGHLWAWGSGVVLVAAAATMLALMSAPSKLLESSLATERESATASAQGLAEKWARLSAVASERPSAAASVQTSDEAKALRWVGTSAPLSVEVSVPPSVAEWVRRSA